MEDELIKKLKKKFSEILFVEEGDDKPRSVISTGSLSLDVSTGVGGIPRGRISVIYGAESSGKTTLCLELAKKALILGLRVLYIDVEQTLDIDYVKNIIGEFDTSRLILVQPDTAESALVIAETAINGDKDVDLKAGQFGLVIVDSVAALAPEKEKEDELTDQHVALSSRILGAFFRRNMSGINRSNVAFVMVNQVRDNIGAYYGGYTLPGGHAMKHYASIIIFLSSGKQIKQKIDNTEVITGTLVKFVVKKNKLSAPFRGFDIPFTFGKGIDYYKDVADFATSMGVIKKRGTYYLFEDEEIGYGKNKMMTYLMEHPETLDKVIKGCYTIAERYNKEQVEEVEEPLEEIIT